MSWVKANSGIPGSIPPRMEADAAWETYRNTYLMRGTAEQKAWAFAQALKAEEAARPWMDMEAA